MIPKMRKKFKASPVEQPEGPLMSQYLDVINQHPLLLSYLTLVIL